MLATAAGYGLSNEHRHKVKGGVEVLGHLKVLSGRFLCLIILLISLIIIVSIETKYIVLVVSKRRGVELAAGAALFH